MPPPLSVFLITLLSTFPLKIQAHNLFQRQALLQSRRCDRPSLLPNRLKIIDVPFHLSCHFSVWTKHKGTLQPKMEILIYMQDQYLSATSNVNLSPTQSRNIKIWFKCDIWIGSQTSITAVGNRGFTNTLLVIVISLPSHYEKSRNLHLQKFIGKSYKPLLNEINLLPCLAFSLLHCSHVHIPNASWHCLPI